MIDLAHLELSLEASSRKQSGGFIAQTHCGSPNMAGHANGSRHADGAVDVTAICLLFDCTVCGVPFPV